MYSEMYECINQIIINEQQPVYLLNYEEIKIYCLKLPTILLFISNNIILTVGYILI